MNDSYFHRVQKQTPTRFWVNNPTLEEAALAIREGADYCTTNPTYAAKMLAHPEMKALGDRILREAVAGEPEDSAAASEVQTRLAGLLMEVFLPVYRAHGGSRGWVSVQGDPEKEEDPREILREAEINRKAGENYIAKVPVTASGLEAIGVLAAEGVPVIATEVMSLSQAVRACETYVKATAGQKSPAPIYVTHITGIFDQHLGEWNRSQGGVVADDILWWAGILAGRKQVRVLRERKYPVTILGGGARGLHHFTEFVGADMHITINWKGTAEELIRQNPPVENRFDLPVPGGVLEELLEKVPVFRSAWEEEGLALEDYGTFPPVELFRSMFLQGWRELKSRIREVRNEQ